MGNFDFQEAKEFMRLLDAWSLRDIRYHGYRFTWTKRSEGDEHKHIKELLDCFLCSAK